MNCLAVLSLLLSVLLSSLMAAETSNYGPETVFENNEVLVEPDVYLLSWNYNETNVVIRIRVKNAKWAGFGISTNGGMLNSDVAIWFMNPDGSPNFTDRSIGNSFSTPTVDERQDWSLLHMSSENGYLTSIFTRKLRVCAGSSTVGADSKDIHYDIVEGTQRFIYAFGSSLTSNNDISYHGPNNRGNVVLPFLNTLKEPNVITAEDEIETHDFYVETTLSNNKDTIYFCQMFKIPEDWMKTKRHILRWETLTPPEMYKYVHHWDLVECEDTYETEYLQSTNGVHPEPSSCLRYDDNPISAVWRKLRKHCPRISLNWSFGSQSTVDMPKDIAYPIGGSGKGSFKYFQLKVHYNNPYYDKDVHLRHGIRLHVTKNYRKIEAGVFIVGTGSGYDGLLIPPKQDRFEIDCYCKKETMNELFGANEEITMFAALAHSHIYGKEMLLKQIRNGEETKHLLKNVNFDFNFQFIEYFSKPIILKKGDELKTTCVYQTKHRNKFLLGGESSNEEMCYNFIWYYPRNENIMLCIDQPTDNERFNLISMLNSTKEIQYNGPMDDELGIIDALEKASPSNATFKMLRNYYDNARRTQIYGYNGERKSFDFDKYNVKPIVENSNC